MAELRGVWLTNVDSDVLFLEKKLEYALAQLAELQFNTIYPVVWNKNQTLYPSPAAKAVTGIYQSESAHVDILAMIVEKAGPLGLQVIPWFEYGLMALPQSALAQRHPDWLTTDRNGNHKTKNGMVWLNVNHQAVRTFMLDLVAEIITTYPVAGIQFDDHFGWPVELGYDSLNMSLFERPLPQNIHDDAWMGWRAESLTKLWQEIHDRFQQLRPDALLSLSPNPHPFAYDHYLVPWPTWDRLGLIDQLIVQVYRQNTLAFTQDLMRLRSTRSRTAIGILSGLRTRAVPMEQIRDQVEVTRRLGFAGFSFFFYETLWNLAKEPADERKAVFAELFKAFLERPDP
jgi:uncharacterized lipoprotein YddW (UPF0748 family)